MSVSLNSTFQMDGCVSVKNFGAIGDGVTDDTIAIQNAINSLTTGGTLFFQKGTYLSNPLKIKSRIILLGDGFNSILKANPNLRNHFITLENVNVERCGIVNMVVDGDNLNQTAPYDIIHFDPIGGRWETNEQNYIFENLAIKNSKNHGIYLSQDCRGSKFNNVDIYWCDGDGSYVIGSDNFFVNSVCWGNGLNGFHNLGGNNFYSNCKGFYNGMINSVKAGDGFFMDESSVSTKLSNCEAQENGRNGLTLYGASNVLVSNFVSDSNGIKNTNGVAYLLDHCDYCAINNFTMTNRSSLAGNMKYGIKIINNSVGNILNGVMPNYSSNKPMNPIFGYIPITNKVTLNGISKNTKNIIAPYERMNSDSNSDGLVDGFIYSKDSGITGTKSFDPLEQCQRLDITGGTVIGKMLLYQDIICKVGDKIGFYCIGKIIGNVVLQVQINFYQGTKYLSTVTGNILKSNQEDTSRIFETIVPSTADKCRLQILVLSQSINSKGTGFVKYMEATIYSNKIV